MERRATIGKNRRHNMGRDMAAQDKLECSVEDETEGRKGRKKVSTWWMD